MFNLKEYRRAYFNNRYHNDPEFRKRILARGKKQRENFTPVQKEKYRAYAKIYNKIYRQTPRYKIWSKHYQHENFGTKDFYQDCQVCQKKADLKIRGEVEQAFNFER